MLNWISYETISNFKHCTFGWQNIKKSMKRIGFIVKIVNILVTGTITFKLVSLDDDPDVTFLDTKQRQVVAIVRTSRSAEA